MTDAPIDEEHKNKVEQQLTLRLAKAIKDKEISIIEAPYIAKKILARFNKLQTHEELTKFLEKLTDEYPMFSEILIIELEEEKEGKDKKQITKIQQLLRDDKIDEALNLAEDLHN